MIRVSKETPKQQVSNRYAVIEILVYYMGLPPHPRMSVTIEGVVWDS